LKKKHLVFGFNRIIRTLKLNAALLENDEAHLQKLLEDPRG
jgi:hypothetical protein